ncbi:MAG: radical SAM protein [Clostridiaceae bacterium]
MIHPCFDGHEHSHTYGRIHIPLIGGCNIKCSYCNRKTNCSNESRPGVTTKVVSIEEGLEIIETTQNTNLRIIGIAGPGDPFSEPEKLFKFLGEIRERYGDKYELCISTNGLVVHQYINKLKELKVNYLTLTINSYNADTLSNLIQWINYKDVVYKGEKAAEILIENQFKSLKAIIDNGIKCKVNTVIVPDINQFEIPKLLKRIKSYGDVIGNLIPIIPVEGTIYENISPLSIMEYEDILSKCKGILNQVKGCKKCRADAAYIRKVN